MLLLSALCSIIFLGGPFRAASQPAPPQLVLDKTLAPLQLAFYGEALCPDCQAYVVNVLEPILAGDELTNLENIVHLTFFAWGNARNVSGGVVCQHGEAECALNRVLECAQHLSPDSTVFWKFLRCAFETAFTQDRHTVVDRCSEEAQIEPDRVIDCAEGPEGEELVLAAGAATPPHSFVPWITLNGVPLGAGCGDTAKLVCDAYEGEKPQGCDRKRWHHQPCPGAPSSSLRLA